MGEYFDLFALQPSRQDLDFQNISTWVNGCRRD